MTYFCRVFQPLVFNGNVNHNRLFISMDAQEQGPWSDAFLEAAFKEHDRILRSNWKFDEDIANSALMG